MKESISWPTRVSLQTCPCRHRLNSIGRTGYPNTPYSIRPYLVSELGTTPAERKRRTQFNVRHAQARIAVEHAFGRLKGRFPVLKNIPGHDLDRIWRLICALLVLHNIVQKIGDRDADMVDWEDDGDLVRMDIEASTAAQRVVGERLGLGRRSEAETADVMRALGKEFREALLDEMWPA